MTFQGFSEAGLQLLSELRANNNKPWFEANRASYDALLTEPAKAFVAAVGERLQSISPRIYFDTRTNGTGSLLRIYRDTRFSADKSPYKTNISGMFWEGGGKKMVSPGFGFQLEPHQISLMGGQFNFPKDTIVRYREAVDDPGPGDELASILEELATTYTINGDQYTRVPGDYENDHPRAELLKYKGLWASTTAQDVDLIMSPALVDFVFEHYLNISPLQQWLAKHTLV